MKTIALIALLISIYPAFCWADSTSTIRRSDGTTAGTVSRSGKQETWRNSDGETAYTRDRDRDGSTWRNSDGEIEWTDDDE